jgi:hypothetical protein
MAKAIPGSGKGKAQRDRGPVIPARPAMPFIQNALALAVKAAPSGAIHGAASVELVDSLDWLRAIEVAAAKAAKGEAAEALSRSHRVRHREQGKEEGGSLPHAGALRPYPPAHRFHERFGDGQPYARAVYCMAARPVYTEEALE